MPSLRRWAPFPVPGHPLISCPGVTSAEPLPSPEGLDILLWECPALAVKVAVVARLVAEGSVSIGSQGITRALAPAPTH